MKQKDDRTCGLPVAAILNTDELADLHSLRVAVCSGEIIYKCIINLFRGITHGFSVALHTDSDISILQTDFLSLHHNLLAWN